MNINFEQLKNMKIKEINEIEKVYSSLPECGFKMNYQKTQENFAEELINNLK